MSWVGKLSNLFGRAQPGGASASGRLAKERLSIILAHQRGNALLSEEAMEKMQRDVLDCVKKYIPVGGPVKISVNNEGEEQLIEMQIALAGEKTTSKTGAGSAPLRVAGARTGEPGAAR